MPYRLREGLAPGPLVVCTISAGSSKAWALGAAANTPPHPHPFYQLGGLEKKCVQRLMPNLMLSQPSQSPRSMRLQYSEHRGRPYLKAALHIIHGGRGHSLGHPLDHYVVVGI